MLQRIASLCSFLGILSLVQGSSSTGYPSATSTSKAAATHTVSVGDGGFLFSPNTTYANVGDVIQFDFYPTNHSVVRAEYQFPCIPYDDTGLGKIGFFSGFQPVIAIIPGKMPTWSVTINDTNPVFYYCSAPDSCIGHGMIGVINPNSSVSLQTQYDLARNSSYMLQPGESFPSEQTPIVTVTPTATATATATSTSSTSSVPATSSAAASQNSQGLSGGAVAGIVVGSIAGILILGCLFFLLGRNWALQEIVKRFTTSTPKGPVTGPMGPPPVGGQSVDNMTEVGSLPSTAVGRESWKSSAVRSPVPESFAGRESYITRPSSPQELAATRPRALP